MKEPEHSQEQGMELTTSKEASGKTLITVNGRLDTVTSPDLDAAVDAAIADGATDLAVDLGEVDFVSSAGLRVIIATQKKLLKGGSVVFRNVQPAVMDVFDVTGFSKLITFE